MPCNELFYAMLFYVACHYYFIGQFIGVHNFIAPPGYKLNHRAFLFIFFSCLQVTTTVPGRAMRRVSSVPSRSHSPAYASSMSPSRGSLRTSVGSAYGSPIVTEPKPLSAIYSTTLPSAQRTSTTGGGSSGSPYNTQKNSPAALRRMGSTNSRSSRTTSPYQASAGSPSGRMGSPLTMVDNVNPPLTKQPTHTSSPVRASMTAVPQHYSSTLPRSVLHNTDPYGPQSYDIYERMTRPDSLAGAPLHTHTHAHTYLLYTVDQYFIYILSIKLLTL